MEARPFNLEFELRLELGLKVELEVELEVEFEVESGLRCCCWSRFKDEVELGVVVGGCYDPSNPYEYE